MKKFFNTEVSTNMGVFLLFCILLLISFLSIPLDYSAYEEHHILVQGEKVDIRKQGVHENASPDESCRLSDDGASRDLLVDKFRAKDIETYYGQAWIPESEVRRIFPSLQSKIDVGCRYLVDRGLELFSQKEYKEGVWLDEGSVCISLLRHCGVAEK